MILPSAISSAPISLISHWCYLLALIAPGSFATEAFTRDYGVMLLVSLIFAVLCWRRQQQPGRLVGALLVGGFVVWLAMLFWTAPLFVE